MVRERIIETDEGIQQKSQVLMYDLMQRKFRDRKWLETSEIIRSGITSGKALEVGCGPAYLGLEWLKKTEGTSLVGLDLSREMLNIAERNCGEYGFTDRVSLEPGNAQRLPFNDDSFDAAFSNGSLHEWSNPVAAFNELYRVLKPGGRFFISDLKRDMTRMIKGLLWLMASPREIRPGFLSSVAAAYTVEEIEILLRKSDITNYKLKSNLIGITITGIKQ